jgi:hypothetical protein
MTSKENRFRAELDEPPRRTQDNYVSALIQAHRALQLAQYCGPKAVQRNYAEGQADALRDVISQEIDRFNEVENE